jgi:acyl-CoA hydrolase
VSPARVCSAAEAAALVRPRDALGIPLGPGQPSAFLHALGERDDFEDLVIHGALLVDLYTVFTRPGVRMRTGFMGPAERFLAANGARIEFVPADFRRFSLVAQRVTPRVVATAASAVGSDGYLSLSLHAGATVDELHRAARDPDRLLIVEANAQLPRTSRLPPEYPHTIHVDEIDVLVESDVEPFVLAESPVTETDAAIARHASAYIHDGCTLQTGIGGVPSMIATLLADGAGGDYGVHSEMFTTGLMRLHRAGKVTNRRKGIHQGYSIATFAAGTRELYEWLDGNDAVRFLPVDQVNDPAIVAANRDMVTINGALLVDLYGQVAADTIGYTQYSGIGGHEDFVAMSGFQLEDRALVCLPSASVVDGVRLSRIVAGLPAGTTVTTPRHHVDVVVTEWGSVELAGMTVRERAFALAEIAHPEFRDDLRAAADRFG